MCIFDHFMYFALLKIFKIVFFVRFSHLRIFYYIILMKKILSYGQKIYIFVFKRGFVLIS